MPKRKKPSAAGKKRKDVSAADNDKGGPPKKKKYIYYCSAEGCTNQAQLGGVCTKHGAKNRAKLCSSEGCTNKAQNGGVCKRHGAKKYKYECTVEGCEKHAQNGTGVCIRHGATWTRKRCRSEGCKNFVVNRGVCMRHGAKFKRCSSEGCNNFAQQGGVCISHGAKVVHKRCNMDGCMNLAYRRGVCIRHGAKKKRCSIDGCSNQRVKGGVCYRHRNNSVMSPSPQGKLLCRDVQGGGNRHNEATVTEISDDEGSKDQISTAKVAVRRSTRSSKRRVNYNEDYDTDAMLDSDDEMEEDEAEVASPKHDESEMTPPKKAKRRGDGEEAKDDREEDAPDVASIQEGEEELFEAMDDGGDWGDDGQGDTDFGGEDNEDVNSAGEMQSHVVPDEITATIPNDNEKEQRVVMLESKLKEAEIEVFQLNEQLSKRSEELEAVKSRSVSDNEQLQSRLEKVKAEIGVQSEVIAQLKKKLEEEKRSKLTWKALWAGQKQKFEEAESWAQAFWRLRREMKKVFAMLKDTKYQLKKKSDALLESEKKVGELTEQNESLRIQLDKQHVEEVAVKEEELTDNEDVMARMKKRGTTQDVTILKAKVDFAVSEAAKREFELDEARDKIEKLSAKNKDLSAENKELHRQMQFKVKWSSRSRPSTSTRDSLHSLEGTT